VTRGGGFEAQESPNGRVLYVVKNGNPGLWSVPVEGGEETLLEQTVHAGNWAVTENGVYFFDFRRREAGVSLSWFSFATQEIVPLRNIGKIVSNAPNLTVSRDGRWIAWAQMDQQDGDLMLIENFR
jgi:hypothetical protein